MTDFVDSTESIERFLFKKQSERDDKSLNVNGRKSYNRMGFTYSEKVKTKIRDQSRQIKNRVQRCFERYKQLEILDPLVNNRSIVVEFDPFYFKSINHSFPIQSFERLETNRQFVLSYVVFESGKHFVGFAPSLTKWEKDVVNCSHILVLSQEWDNDIILFSFGSDLILFSPKQGYLLSEQWRKINKKVQKAAKLLNVSKNEPCFSLRQYGNKLTVVDQ